ncbi:Annexin D3 [Linum grandiflorum]
MATLRVPDAVPTATQDSERLRKAFKGVGTDEKATIWILGHRNASQRRMIRDTYQQLYHESLIDRLHSELSRDFRRAMILWTYDPAERDAVLANKALTGKKKGFKQLECIVEIACATSPHHLQSVKQIYSTLFDSSLEEDISVHVSFPIRKLLGGLVRSYRYDKELVDMNFANMEASKLHEAIKTNQLYHDDVIYILSTRNVHQLRITFDLYKQRFGNSIDQDLKDYGEGDMESLLRAVVQCIYCPAKHFAEVIKTSVNGLGTDEKSLTRAIVTRAEIDLMKIREEYTNLYGTQVEDAITGDTSGDYKNLLKTLLGARV